MEQYRTILESSPDNWRAHRGMGEAQLALSRPEQAKNHLKSALLQDPSASDKLPIYQSLLEADRAINGEGSLGEDGKDALVQLASLYLEQGRTDQARQRLQTLQSDYPDYRPERVAELQSQLESQASSQSGSPSSQGQAPHDDASMGEGQ
jgi:tetratricopeptide (TPR) repeat protein